MSKSSKYFLLLAICLAYLFSVNTASALDLVRDGKPVATIVVVDPESDQWDKDNGPTDGYAAKVFAQWVEKMSGAQLSIQKDTSNKGVTIYLGQAALDEGLKLGDIKSRSREGMRIESDGKRVLLAGQSNYATLKATCRLLEELGCRFLMDHPLGEIYPESKNISLPDNLRVTDQPGLAMRRIWGSVWSSNNLWKVWNGSSGVDLPTGHAWGSYIDRGDFANHPEWFALRDGERRKGDWYCTSNKELRAAFTKGVIEKIENGSPNVSLSPPDGRGYCECEDCRAQDDPKNIEPSSGAISISNRYADFYKAVAEEVARKHPDSILSFYCYADYTQAPSSGIDLPDNLVAWIAPIRYCRYHHIGAMNCPSRHQLASLVEGWGKAADQLGYRTYNFNLASTLVPFSKVQIWEHDIPYLKKNGASGINFETFRNWRIYGPHIYQSIRVAYDPDVDVKALMDDYYLHFYGKEAGPLMAQYWRHIEDWYAEMNVHAGSYYAIHNVYTAEHLEQLRSLVDQALDAAKFNPRQLERVRMTQGGFQNAKEYIELRNAINQGDLKRMQKTYDSLVKRTDAAKESGLGYHYTVSYLKRFLGKNIAAAMEATEGKARVLSVLPDEWKLEYAPEGDGLERGFHKTEFDDSDWKSVRTFSDTLNAQGFEDRVTVMWYRVQFEVPKDAKKLRLFFYENDGLSTVFINGKLAGESQKSRLAFSVDADLLKTGKNKIAVRIDHSKITELDLGGMLRPVYLIGE